MNKIDKTKESLPEDFSTLEKVGEFWDTCSMADYEDIFEPVDVEITLPPRITGPGTAVSHAHRRE